jgi:peptide/nickel transport system permease protein
MSVREAVGRIEMPVTVSATAVCRRVARLRRFGLAVPAGAVLLMLLVIAAAPGLFTSVDPNQNSMRERLRAPSVAHPFGTDEFGRDLWSRVVHGTRNSLVAGLGTVALALIVGTAIGLVAGLGGARLDNALMRVVDVFLAFPYLALAIAVGAILGRSLPHAMIALAVAWWPQYARLMRGQVLAVKGADFVQGARASGAGSVRVALVHVMPNAIAPVFVKASLDVGYAILAVAGLSFLGLGVAPPTPEWGALIATGRNYMFRAWWYLTFPGLAIFLTVMACNLFGDGLRDWFDPHLERG